MFDNHLGLAPTSFDIAHMQVRLIADIERQFLFIRLVLFLFGDGSMSATTSNLGTLILFTLAGMRRIWLHSGNGVHDGWKRFVIYINGGNAVFRSCLRLRENNCYGMPAPEDFMLGQRGLRARTAATLLHTQRLTRIDSLYAWNIQCSRGINIDDAGMSKGTEYQTCM